MRLGAWLAAIPRASASLAAPAKAHRRRGVVGVELNNSTRVAPRRVDMLTFDDIPAQARAEPQSSARARFTL